MKIRLFVLTLIFFALLFGGVEKKTIAQGITVAVVGTATWTDSGLDVNGGPETSAFCEWAISGPAVDLKTGGAFLTSAQFATKVGPNQANVSSLFSGKPTGKYRLWARLIDGSKNASVWAGPLDISIDQASPSAPSAIGFSISVSVK